MDNPLDWRISYFRKIINTFSDVLAEVYQTHFENLEPNKIIEREKLIENIIGMGFLTSQIYISGTIADAKMFSQEPENITKKRLFKEYGKLLPGTDITSIALCDAYANYYKHNEEWIGKSIDQLRSNAIETIRTLNSAGIDVLPEENRMVEVPFSRIIDLLLITRKGVELSVLLSILSEWRSRVINSVLRK
jgi:hypothetical protein